MNCARCQAEVPVGASACPSCQAPSPGTASMPIPAHGTGLESTVREIAAGDLLADTYRVVKKLGEGGMGTVLLAKDEALGRDVAVKVLARHLCEDDASVARFEREAQLTAQLDHPNIVPVYAVGRFHDRPFMVMKVLDGVSLAQRLQKQKGPWAWSAVRPIIAPLCDGLTYLHQKGLVHRDVKPSNVYVGPTGHVTLLDFGVLKESSRDFTRTGQMLGTLRFAAPEQLTESSQVDARADVYALGVMLYRLIAGQTPFGGDDLQIAQKKLAEDPPSASTWNPTLPPLVVDALLKAVSRNRDDRYGSAREVLAALDRGYANPEAPRPQRRSRLAMGLLAAAAAALLVAGVWKVATVSDPVKGVAPAEAVVLPTRAPVPPETVPLPPEPPHVAAVAAPEAKDTGLPPPRDASHRRPPRSRPVSAAETAAPVKVSVVTTLDGKSSYAELAIDGVGQGETPAQVELTPGVHRLKLTRPGFRPHEQSIKLTSGKPERVVIELQR